VLKEGLELKETEKKQRGDKASQFNNLCGTVKEALIDKVKKVIISNCITNSPCVLVTGQFSWSSNMECIMKVQALCDLSMLSDMALKKTLKLNLNPSNTIIKELKCKVTEDKADKSVHDLTYLLFEMYLWLCPLRAHILRQVHSPYNQSWS
jgi:molecular chaperone HtpG